MINDHPISDEVLQLTESALNKGEHWMAYNRSLYFIDTSDVHFFSSQKEANEFADNNFSDQDNFYIVHFNSIQDIYKEIPYSEKVVIDPDANGLYNHEGTAFTDALIDYIEQQQSLSNSQLKTNVMNEKNLDYLSKQLKFTGFGEGHSEELKEKIQQQTPEFTIFHEQDFGKDKTVATLQFKKSDESDMYFFNRYNLLLKNDQQADPLKQTFFINNKEDNITLKEAYNLMNGRAVHKELTPKEGEKYTAWLQLDFKAIDKNGNYETKKFHQNYGYDLEQSLAKHPIKELSNDVDRGRLMESLQRGNRQSVTIQNEGAEKKMFIEASPQFKSINFYDSSQKRVTNYLSEKQGHSTEEKQSSKKSAKQDGADDDGPEPKQGQKRSRKKSQGVS